MNSISQNSRTNRGYQSAWYTANKQQNNSKNSSDPQKIKVCARGKLLLFGEYLAVLGESSIGIPLDVCMTATYSPHPQDYERKKNIKKLVPDLEIQSEVAVPDEFYIYLEKVCKGFGVNVVRGSIVIESTVPVSAGLGSSAAFCVCIAKIILLFHFACMAKQKSESVLKQEMLHSISQGTDEQFFYQVWLLAYYLENYFHKKSSGIDTALSLFENALLFTKNVQQSFGQNVELGKKEEQMEVFTFFQNLNRLENKTLHIETYDKRRVIETIGLEPRELGARMQALVAHVAYKYVTRVGQNMVSIPQKMAEIMRRLEMDDETVRVWIEAHRRAIALLENYVGVALYGDNDAIVKKPRRIKTDFLELLAVEIDCIQACLCEFNIGIEEVDREIKLAKQEIAYAGKTSGAGHGGAFYVILKDATQKTID